VPPSKSSLHCANCVNLFARAPAPLGSEGVRSSPAREHRILLRLMTPHEAPSVEQDATTIRTPGRVGITYFRADNALAP